MTPAAASTGSSSSPAARPDPPRAAASPPGSAASPSRRRWRWTPRPRRSRRPAGRSSASAPASPTSRPRTTSSRPPSRPAATRATTATRRPAGLPELKKAIADKTLRDSGLRRRAGPGARHQRRQAGRLRGVRDAARPGRRGAAAGAVLDDLPRGDPARRRRAGRGARRRDPGLQGHRRRSSRRRVTDRTKALLFCSPSNPTGAVDTRERGRGDRPLGCSSTGSGWSPTRSTST